MSYRPLGRCPVCQHAMEVRELHCPHCGTTIRGRFLLGRFAHLTPEQWDFLEVFVRNRGNIREMEKDLGLSYPAVRSRLDQLLLALGYPPDPKDRSEGPEAQDRLAILEKVEKGELTPAEAARLLRGERSHDG
ncbi:MAG: DUF2089 domain-containing protein [Clostridiales bacterium]|nr:DUF2089 domain-containing protein [Clostridiales bacterium]